MFRRIIVSDSQNLTRAVKATMDFVKSKIAEHPVYVISKSGCPYCKKAKELLNSLGAKYVAEEIDNRSDVDEIQDACLTITGARTVPRVFIGGKCIGGGSETADLHKKGKLVPLLKEVGAL